MKFTIGDRLYVISFRHKTTLGRRPELHRHSPVKAITTCVVAVQKPNGDLELVAIDSALCSHRDNFCRRDGRVRAFAKVLTFCGALRGVVPELERLYMLHDPPKSPKPLMCLSQAAIEERIAEGAEIRAARAAGLYRRAGK